MTDAILYGGDFRPERGPYTAGFILGRVPLRGPLSLGLFVNVGYQPVERGTGRDRWNVEVLQYVYDVLGTDGQKRLTFHWHPQGISDVTWPHLHVYAVMADVDSLHRKHLPTGFVAVAGLVRTLIRDFAVRPLRDDWQSIIDFSSRSFPTD